MLKKPKNNISEDRARIDAMINECKGNLFEYLVGLRIAQLYGKEIQFHNTMGPSLKSQLKNYEKTLYKLKPELYTKLTANSDQTARAIFPLLKDEIQEVKIVGKLEDDLIRDEFKEADLLLTTKTSVIPLSLKLAKKDSYVNTKSAGVKSFLTKYFSNYQLVKAYQEELNLLIDRAYYKMGQELYQMIGLEFKGEFDQSWFCEGYSDLPGKLPLEMRKIVQKNYQETIFFIYEIFQKMSEEKEIFANCLLPLIGLGNEKLLQIICFCIEDLFDSIVVNDSLEKLNEIRQFRLMSIKPDISSFEIVFPGFNLQIRIKPMNKFTTPSYKINCSVRYGVKHAHG